MPQNKDLKRLVRARMAETGENYTRVLTALLGETGELHGAMVDQVAAKLGGELPPSVAAASACARRAAAWSRSWAVAASVMRSQPCSYTTHQASRWRTSHETATLSSAAVPSSKAARGGRLQGWLPCPARGARALAIRWHREGSTVNPFSSPQSQ